MEDVQMNEKESRLPHRVLGPQLVLNVDAHRDGLGPS